MPGVLYPFGNHPEEVERCDDCKRFADDWDAAYALARHVGGLVLIIDYADGWSPVVTVKPYAT